MQTAHPALPVVRTLGSKIFLADGTCLIDGVASWWTACHGYNHPYIVEAISDQLALLPHVMLGGLAHEPAYTLARRLALLRPDVPHVFFSDSGSVAIEVALKIARQYWSNSGKPQRSQFVSFTDGYHGDTLGAMMVSDPKGSFRSNIAPFCRSSIIADLPASTAAQQQLVDLLDAHQPNLAGVIIEPLVQGAGGMRMHAPEVLQFVVKVARERDILIIFDEIFTGFGRTGTMFASDQACVVPDILTLSKALTGGFLGLAATMTSTTVFQAFLSEQENSALMHGPTFMGNALACAAANASLDLFENHDRLQQVQAIQRALNDALCDLAAPDLVHDVRILGAIGAVELKHSCDREALRARFLKEGVWIRPLEKVIYLTPALTIEPSELATLTQAIKTVLQ